MALITGITGAAAEPEGEVRFLSEPLTAEIMPDAHVEPEPEPMPEKPEPGLTERSYTLVGRAMRFVMKTVIPDAWQMVVQDMAKHLPNAIKLEAVEQLQWENDARHRQLAEDLRDQGFVDAGQYMAASMDTKIQLLVNEAYDVRAVLYEHSDSNMVLDLVTLFGDGTGVTYVNRDDPGIEQSPLHPNVYMGEVPVFELLDACLRERPKKARLPESVAVAARLTELEYEFGTRRLRGESVNPVEIAEAYLDAIEMSGKRDEVPTWTARAGTVLPLDEALSVAAEGKKAVAAAKS